MEKNSQGGHRMWLKRGEGTKPESWKAGVFKKYGDCWEETTKEIEGSLV